MLHVALEALIQAVTDIVRGIISVWLLSQSFDTEKVRKREGQRHTDRAREGEREDRQRPVSYTHLRAHETG